MIACDAIAVSCARAVHTMPDAQSLLSSVVKKVVTDLSEEAFARCADVLGTRAVLREGPEGVFDVLRTDNAVVRYFDTSPIANLRLVTTHLNTLGVTPVTTPADRIAATFDLDAELPDYRPEALGLSARGRDGVTQAFAEVAGRIRDMVNARSGDIADARSGDIADARGCDMVDARGCDMVAARGCDTVDARVGGLLDQVEAGLAVIGGQAAALLGAPGEERACGSLDLAARFCFLHAAASCAHLWWFNRDRALYGTPAGSTGWLTAVLTLLLDRADQRVARLPLTDAEAALTIIESLRRGGRLFSSVPLPLAGATPADRVDQSEMESA